MAKSKRSTETLVAAIEEQLGEMASEGQHFAAAVWGEADGDAGYILHTDGRMVDLGEYQYGFSQVREMLDPTLNEEVSGDARREAGRIAGSMEPLDLDQVNKGTDDFGVMERLPYAFHGSADVVESAIATRKVSFEQLFDLLTKAPGRLVLEGNASDTHQITLAQDVDVAALVVGEDGTLAWSTQVVARQGDIVPGLVHQDRAYAKMAGGQVLLKDGEYQAEPIVRKPSGPHCH